MSYNLHGFNQGVDLLSDVCDNNLFDVLFLQEHWLSDVNMTKFNRFANYSWFGISAMSTLLNNDVLIGRPYGGCCTLVNYKLAAFTSIVLQKERLVILKINNYLFINVYFPCKENSLEYKEILLDMLAEISNVIDNLDYGGIYLGGDFNNSLTSNKEDSVIIKNFLKSYDLSYIDLISYNASELFTFSNSVRGCYSVIDFICVSSALVPAVEEYTTYCYPLNLSDHEPVIIKLNVSLMKDFNFTINNAKLNVDVADAEPYIERRFRFEHGNIAYYYEYTRVLIDPIMKEIISVYNALDYNVDIECLCSNSTIDRWYSSIVDSLLNASHATIPYTKSNHFKEWWDSELTELKNNCMLSHDEWKCNGKPRSGPIFEKRNSDKKQYRSLIQVRKSTEKLDISNSLLYSLYNETGTKFWKNWKNKTNNSPTVTPKIVGTESDASACVEFKSYFEKLSAMTDHAFDNGMRSKFYKLLNLRSQYNDRHKLNDLNRELYSATLIDMAIGKLNNSTGVGVDGLQKHHFIHAHPSLHSTLSKLFYLMMLKSYVPNKFGCGIVVPIQKDTSLKGKQKLDNFRGITLSPIIAKIFEYSIMFLYGKYFVSSDRQFGFKQNLGCVHAIFCVRNVIDYFVTNDSSVNVCLLDISKAFDKVNHNCLFVKLLQLSVPLCVVRILHDWYSKMSARVKFGNFLSNEYVILCGVRQGGVLSPSLFCLYVDNILKRLSKYGCHMNNVCYSSFLYADDLIILAPTRSELIRMINVVYDELQSINLKLNCEKSCCISIGPRYVFNCTPITTNAGIFNFVNEAKYLGVTIAANHRKFKVSFSESKCKFYSAFNNLYAKLGNSLDLNVIVHLFKSMILPIIMYAVESLILNKSCLNSLEFSLNRVLYKIFKVNESSNRSLCMKMFNIDTIDHLYNLRRNKFNKKIKEINNTNLSYLISIDNSYE